MNFYFVRHGSTLMNELNKAQGWLNSDLTETGKEELHELYSETNFPEFDSAYSSDLGRAIDTLELMKKYININNPDNIFQLKDLRERFLGSFEGDNLDQMKLDIAQKKGYESYADYQKENTFADYINDNWELDPNGYTEDFQTFKTRVEKGFNEIQNEAIANDWENVLIVAHQNPIRIIQYLLLEKTSGFERGKLSNGEFLLFSHENGQWTQMPEE